MDISKTTDQTRIASERRIFEILEDFHNHSMSEKVESLNDALSTYTAVLGKSMPDRVAEMTHELTETVNFIVKLHEEYSFYKKFCDV